MSDYIHINKTFISDSVDVIGASNLSIYNTVSDRLATSANNLVLTNLPAMIGMVKSITTIIGDTSSINSTTTHSYIKYLSVHIENETEESAFLSSAFYTNHKDKITIAAPVYARFSSAITQEYKIPVSFRGDEVTSGVFAIPITDPFPNIFSNSIPLTDIYLKNEAFPITVLDEYSLTSSEIIECLTITSKLSATSFVGARIDPTTDAVVFRGTFPSKKKGKLFVKYFSATEQNRCHSLYAYQGKNTPNSTISILSEPNSLTYWRDIDIKYEVYESDRGRYRNANKYLNLVSDNEDYVSSSFNTSYLSRPFVNVATGEFLQAPLNMSWEHLSKIAWLDCVMLQFVFYKGNTYSRRTDRISLAKCIIQGVDTEEGETDVTIQIFLPDLCNLMADGYSEFPGIDKYLGGFHPMSPITMELNVGYQSDYLNSNSLRSGLHIDGKKLRRLYIGNTEVQSFVVNELPVEQSRVISGTASVMMNKDGVTYYVYTTSITTSNTVLDARLVSTDTNTICNVTYSGNVITIELWHKNRLEKVNATLYYTVDN